MITKLFEIRDAQTFIPVVAILCQVTDLPPDAAGWQENYLLRRAGYNEAPLVLIIKLVGGDEAHYDPYAWRDFRTMRNAHLYIQKNFHQLDTGEVIDVEYLLGETTTKKVSESTTAPL